MLNARKPSVSSHTRHRGTRQQSPVHSRIASTVPRAPYLSGHGGASDLEKFHEAWRIKATTEHPLFTELFFERTLPVARMLDITQAELNALPNNAAREKLREQVTKTFIDSRAKLMNEFEVLCKKYFNTLSSELQHQVRTRATFAEVWASFNPLELIRLVESTVNNPLGDAAESSELVTKAQRAFYGIRQYDTENLPFFFNRFQRVMNHFESVIQVAMYAPLQMKIQIFLDAFNNRCKPYADYVNSEAALGRNDVFPLSVADAVTKATNWLNRRQQMRGPVNIFSPAFQQPPQAVFALDRTSQKKFVKKPRVMSATVPTPKPRSDGPPKDLSQIECYNCGKMGHYKSKCPCPPRPRAVLSARVEDDHDDISFAFMMTLHGGSDDTQGVDAPVYTVAQNSNPGLHREIAVQIDSASQLNVVGARFPLENERPCPPIIARGICGEMRLSRVGNFGPLVVFKDPAMPANIFSWAEVEKVARVTYVQGTGVTVRFHGDTIDYFFVRGSNNLYTCVLPSAAIFSATIAERARQFSKAEADRAHGVHELRRRLGGASTQDLLKFLGTSPPLNCPFHAEDVRREIIIYGPDLANLKGKMTSPRPQNPLVVPVDYGEQRLQQLHADIFEVSGVMFLLAVMVPLKYTFASSLPSKSIPDLVSAMQAIAGIIQSKGFVVVKIMVDPETGLQALVGLLPMDVEVAAPGTHVPRAERQGRTVKERMRTIIAALPFNLAARFLKYLVFFVVTRLNLIPRMSDGSNVSPRERFTKRKTVFNREFELAFGDTAEIFNSPEQLNSMEPRSVSAMALYPIGNDQGGWRFYKFSIGTVVSSSKWNKTPIQDLQIKLLNDMASEDAINLGRGKRVKTTLSRVTDPSLVPFERMLVNPNLEVAVAPPGEELVYTGVPAAPPPPAIAPAVPDAGVPDADHDPADVPELIANDVDAGDDAVPDPDVIEFDVPAAAREEPRGERRSARQAAVNAHERQYNVFMSMADDNMFDQRCDVFRLSESESTRRYGDLATQATQEEFNQIAAKKVVACIRLASLTNEQRARIIHSSLFHKEKYGENGELIRLKARLVAAGNEMDRDLYDSGSSPTVAREAVFAMMALSAASGAHRMYIDIGTAFLEAPMGDNEVYMYIGKKLVPYLIKAMPSAADFVDDKGRVLVRLQRALYGCIQSSRLWYEHLRGILFRGGFSVNPYDSCVFHKNVNGETCTICLHVDDLFVSSSSENVAKELIALLEADLTEVKVNQGKVNSYLGMRVTETDAHLEVDMCNYVDDCIRWMNVPGDAATPADTHLFDIDESNPLLGVPEQERFHSAAARLLYASKGCRPDILPAVSFLTSRVGKATDEDGAKIRRVFKYLHRFPDLVIAYPKKNPEVKLFAYVDAAYGVHPTGQSRSGLVITINGAPVLCKTARQRIVTKSSTEAELVALSDALTDVLWMREFLLSAGCLLPATPIGEDNEAVLKMLRERKFGTARTKHINVRYFFIVDRMVNDEVSMVAVPTAKQLADYMTKPLTGHQFEVLRSMLLRQRDTPVPAGGVLMSELTKT